jgi:protein involved in polysaccharide export with SLBB domain
VRALTVSRRVTYSMIKICRIASISLAFCTFSALAQGPAVPTAQGNSPAFPTGTTAYRLTPGDQLSVIFPFNGELNHDGPVSADGRFTLPYVGELPVAGMTTADVADMISKSLVDQGIAANAHPAVTVNKYSLSVYVGGEVKTPGMIQLSTGMDALQAVLVAGGMLDTAKTKHVAIIRRSENNTSKVIYLDLDGYTKGKAAATTAMLEPHDVIFVPKSSIAEVDRWVDDYINKTIPFQRNLNYNAGNYGAATIVQ